MIPKLIPNEEFYNTISTGNRPYFRNMEEPYEEYANLEVVVYPVNAEMFIGKDNLFNEFKHCRFNLFPLNSGRVKNYIFTTKIILNHFK